jgi:exodeoxyribonuclease VII large subunit
VDLFSVGALASAIKAALERDPALRDVWVTGEVSSLSTSAAGHRYFTIKDADAGMRAVLFRGGAGAEHVANGAQVNLHGRVGFYTVRGDTQFYVDAVVPAGMGVLAAEFERLRALLAAEGLFEPSRKRPLPPFPKRIGVVTSEHGAVIHDIINVLTARYPMAEVVLCPASVQGEGAEVEIAQAIATLNGQDDIDVLIVGRGGGSMEDLWSFNTEVVARAIHGSRIPVISAVGHESDVTIADFVADLRAPTPSAAAAAATPDVRVLTNEVRALAQRAYGGAANALAQRSRAVETQVAYLRRHLPDAAVARLRVDDVLERGRAALAATLRLRREQTMGAAAQLAALNPQAVLERGFAALTDPATGQAVTSVRGVVAGTLVRASVRDGHLDARVEHAAPAEARTPTQERTDG